jgi:hypothetical protein
LASHGATKVPQRRGIGKSAASKGGGGVSSPLRLILKEWMLRLAVGF